MSNFFKFKDTVPPMLRSSIVYKYKCSNNNCAASYVGSSTRMLRVRAAEHMGISHRTNLPLSSLTHSAIRDHASGTCGSALDFNNFSIIDSHVNPISLRIIESLHIHKLKPSLNETESAFPLHITQ